MRFHNGVSLAAALLASRPQKLQQPPTLRRAPLPPEARSGRTTVSCREGPRFKVHAKDASSFGVNLAELVLER